MDERMLDCACQDLFTTTDDESAMYKTFSHNENAPWEERRVDDCGAVAASRDQLFMRHTVFVTRTVCSEETIFR